MRVLVCGGRDYTDYDKVAQVLAALDWRPGDVLVHGAARGADMLAHSWASSPGSSWPLQVEAYPADWTAHGKSAGPIRNQQMLDTGIDLVIAFPGGRGTDHMKTIARAAGVTVLEVT